MKQIITYLVVMVLLVACSFKKDKEANIKTLNKETIYIKKMKKKKKSFIVALQYWGFPC